MKHVKNTNHVDVVTKQTIWFNAHAPAHQRGLGCPQRGKGVRESRGHRGTGAGSPLPSGPAERSTADNPSVSPSASHPRSFNRRNRHCRACCSFHSPTAGRFALRASAHWAPTSLRRPLHKCASGIISPQQKEPASAGSFSLFN